MMYDLPMGGQGLEPKSYEPSPLPIDNSTKSFWHSEPVLQGHRTTNELPSYAEFVIVGSGITGTSALRYLIDAGVKGPMLMLEAREACWGATGRNGGHLQPLLIERSHDVVAFENQNCKEVGEYITSNDIQCEYRPVAACRTYWTEDSLNEAKQSIQELQRAAPELAKGISIVPDASGMEKAGVRSDCNGATLTQGAASLSPYKYVTWILKNMIEKGHVNLQTNTPVTNVEPMSLSESVEGVDLNARYKLLTPRGMICARNVLLATNAYTSHLIPEFADLIVPVRETMTALVPPQSMREILPHSYGIEAFSRIGTGSSGEYLVQRPSSSLKSTGGNDTSQLGHLMLGGGRTFGKTTMPSVGVADDSVIDSAVVDYLQSSLPNALLLGAPFKSNPESEKVPPLKAHAAWTGIWAASRDSNPFVGPVPLVDYPFGLWICAAYTGHGMPNATLCAKAVVRMMLEANSLANSGSDKEIIERKLEKLKEEMITMGDLPKSYFLTKERMEKARKLPDVHTQDELGILGEGIDV